MKMESSQHRSPQNSTCCTKVMNRFHTFTHLNDIRVSHLQKKAYWSDLDWLLNEFLKFNLFPQTGHFDAIWVMSCQFTATSSDFKSTFTTLSTVLESSSKYHNVCKHLVYNVYMTFIKIPSVVLQIGGGFITTTFLDVTIQYLLFIFWFRTEQISPLI